MAFDPSTIAGANQQVLTAGSGVRPASDITDPVSLPIVIPADCDAFADLAPDIHEDTVLLIESYNEADAGTSIVDSSDSAHAISVISPTHSTDQTKLSRSSLKFDYGDYLQVTTDHADHELGSNDFTVRAWVYLTSYATNNGGYYSATVMAKDHSSGRGFGFVISGTATSFDSLGFTGFETSVTYTTISEAHSFSLNTWYHVEAVRVGSSVYLFVDGELLNTGGTSFSRTIQDTATLLKIGATIYDGTYFYYFTGYMQGIELINGTGLHTDDFTVPNRLFSVSATKKLAIIDRNDDQCPVEISPNEWEKGPEPISRWDFDNIVSSTLEDVVGTDDGTITNLTDTAGGPFDNYQLGAGIDSTIRKITFGTGIPVTSASFWFKRLDLTNWHMLLRSADGDDGTIVVNRSGGSPANTIYVYNGSNTSTDFTVTDTDWHHLVVVQGSDNDNYWIWLDGVKNSSEIDTGWGGNILGMGAWYTNSNGEFGGVTNFQTFDFKLTDAQIAMLYAAGARGNQYTANHAVIYTQLPDFLATAPSGGDCRLVWDGAQDDNDVRSAADASDDFTGTDGDAPSDLLWEIGYDAVNWWDTAYDGTADIQSNALSFAVDSTYCAVLSKFKFSGACEFTFDLVKHASGVCYLDLIDDSNNRLYISFSSTEATSLRQMIGGSWDTATSGGTAPLSCTVKVVRNASNVMSFYFDTTLIGTRTLAADFVFRVRMRDYDSTIDNFTVNSADAITGYVGDTGSIQAQAVWPSDYKAVYHMAQDPSGGTDSVLDSTSNEITLSPTNMGATNLVDVDAGKGLLLNGTDEYLTTASESVLDLTDEITIIAKITPSSLWSSAMANGKVLFDRQTSSSNDSYGLSIEATDGELWFGTLGGNIQSTKASWAADTEFVIVGTYKATGLEGDLFVDGIAEILSTDNYDTMAGVTVATRIGALGGTASKYADMTISELQVVNAVLTADEVALASDAYLNTLFTWTDYTSSTSNIQFWNMPYDNLLGDNVAYWNEVYSIFFPRVQSWDEIYGILLTIYWNLPYGNNPLLSKYWDERYGDNPIIRQWFDLRYDDRVSLLKYWDEKYNLNKGILQHWNEGYAILGKELVKYFDENYDIKNTNPVLKHFDEYYHIMADSVVEAAALGFYIDGVKYEGPYHVSFELNKDSYKNTGEMHFNYPTPFFAASEGTEMRIVDTDIDLYLDITIPTKRETVRETTYIIPGESKSRRLEIANVFTEDFEETFTQEERTAKTIVTTIANRQGIDVDWQIPDWHIDEYIVNDQTPYQAIHRITSAAGAIIQSDFNGNIYVCKSMKFNSHQWDIGSPEYFLEDNLHFFSTNQSSNRKPGYNKVMVSDQALDDEVKITLDDEEYGVNQRLVKAYRVPWDDGVVLDLKTSDTAVSKASIRSLDIGGDGVDEEFEEAISIVNGEGENQTTKPFYKLVSWSYNDTDLGEPEITEEGLVQTPIEGQSLLTIVYRTKYYQWVVADTDDEQIQVWVE